MGTNDCNENPDEKPTAEQGQALAAIHVPDPEEDDLDDLDDMLDDFATTTASGPTQKPETVPTSSGIDKAAETEALDSDAFAKDLQNQMAALMGSIDESRDIKDHVDNVLGELGDPGNQENSNKQSASASKGEEVFQETIRRTMERLQASSSQAEPATQEEESENFLEQMLKEMQNGELPQDSDEKGLNQMLMGMMEQLTNKEILYDPMKELHEKYPTWMETNREKTKPEDMKRYEEQQTLVRKIVERFERKEYSDSNVADREYIVDHMQQMQAAGSPPADLVGGMEASEALGDMESACAQQ